MYSCRLQQTWISSSHSSPRFLRSLKSPLSSCWTTATRKGRWDCSCCFLSKLLDIRKSVAPALAHRGQETRRLSTASSTFSSIACTAANTEKVCQPLRCVCTLFSTRKVSSYGDGLSGRARCWKRRIVTLVRLLLLFARRRKSQTLACSSRERAPSSFDRTKFTVPGELPEIVPKHLISRHWLLFHHLQRKTTINTNSQFSFAT